MFARCSTDRELDMPFLQGRWFPFALLAASALIFFGCSSSQGTAGDKTFRCAKSARAAYQAGKLVCARRMARSVNNPVSRHEILSYVHFKFGNLEKGVAELDRAVKLLEKRKSVLAREHRFQLQQLKTRLSVFRSALQYRLQKAEKRPVVADSSSGRSQPRRIGGWGGKQPSGQSSDSGSN